MGDEMKKLMTDQLRRKITSGSYYERNNLKKFKEEELPTLDNLTEEYANQTPDFVSTEDKPSLLDKEKDRHDRAKERIVWYGRKVEKKKRE